MATKKVCDGCGADLSARILPDSAPHRSTVPVGQAGDGVDRGVEIRLGGARVAVDTCPDCQQRVIAAVRQSLPALSVDLLAVEEPRGESHRIAAMSGRRSRAEALGSIRAMLGDRPTVEVLGAALTTLLEELGAS